MRRWWRTEDQTLLENLGKAIRGIAPDYVVLSGDIVNKCSRKSLEKAANTLRRLFTGAGLDIKSQVLLIPGNHDVKLFPTENEYFGRVAEFLWFLQVFFDERSMLTRKTKFIRLDAKRRLCFFCLDSTLKDKQPAAEGEVGRAQLEWLEGKQRQLLKTCAGFESFVRIVVLHHHPHPIEAGGPERLMQLLDAGEVISSFRHLEVNIVLHGHKHFPHHKQEFYDTNRHYVVAGAGTATCPFPEEQAGEGNNFHILRLEPSKNLLEIQMMKADNNKEYHPHYPQPVRYPLFQPSVSGYRITEFRILYRILDLAGTSLITSQRIGIFADKPDYELKKLMFSFNCPEVSEIVEFNYDTDSVSGVEFETKTKRVYKGRFTLIKSLKWGSEPLGMNSFTIKVTRGFCMKASEYQTFYPGKTSLTESNELAVVHPCDQLTCMIEFPYGYRVEPHLEAKDLNGMDLEMRTADYSLKEDLIANRYTLVVVRPVWQAVYSMVWKVPEGD